MDMPWHSGEQALHARTGAVERMAEIGRQVIRDHMPDQHRELFNKLPTMLLGALDASGQPWATMLAGPPGFGRHRHRPRSTGRILRLQRCARSAWARRSGCSAWSRTRAGATG